MRMREHEARQIGTLLLDEAQIRQNDVDAGIVLAFWEGNAEIDHQPFSRLGRPKPVEAAIHAELADAAERHEYKLVIAGRIATGLHQPRSCKVAPASVTSPNVSRRDRPSPSRMRSAPPSSRPRKVPAICSRP